jgi:hypothetical protein
MSATSRFVPLILSALLATGLAGAQTNDNPLLTVSPLPLRYPQFDKLRDEHFAPALDRGMAEQLAEVQAIADNPAPPTFDNTLVAWEKSGRLLSRTTALLSNLTGADATPARQQLQADYAPRLAAQRDAVLLNPRLFARVEALYTQRDKAAPDAEARRLIERYHRDMVRAGAQLNDEQKTRMKAINAELATLSARFNRAVLAEVNDSAVIVDSAEELAGLSPAAPRPAGQVRHRAAEHHDPAVRDRPAEPRAARAPAPCIGRPWCAWQRVRHPRHRRPRDDAAPGTRGAAGPCDTRGLCAGRGNREVARNGQCAAAPAGAGRRCLGQAGGG